MTTQELADTVQAAAAAADAGWRAWSTGFDEIAAIGFARAERHYTAAGMVNLARDMADARQRCERRAEYQAMLDYARNYGAE